MIWFDRHEHSSAMALMAKPSMGMCCGLVLVGLSACAAQPAPPAPLPATTMPVRAPRDASPAPLELVPPPADAARPVVVIGDEHITIEGKFVGSVRELDRVGKLQKIDELFENLKARREAWKATHEGEAFPAAASLVVAPSTSGRAFASAYQTIAFAGFPNIQVAVGGQYYETEAQIPGPPCGLPENPCPPRPRQQPVVLHVQADEQLWRLRVPRENGPLDERGEGESSTVESFRAAVSRILSTTMVGHIMIHVAPDVPFSRLAPFLAEVVTRSRTLQPASAVTVSVRAIDGVRAMRGPLGTPFVAMGKPAITGQLAPELVQKAVRSAFAGFRACYEQALTRDPKAEGTSTTRFVVSKNGTVAEAHTTLSGSLPPEMGTCVEGVVRSLTLDTPSGGVVTVTYPIAFRRSE